MTREEAIAILEVSKHMATSGRMYNQAIDMAIEALHREEAEAKGYCHRIKPKELQSRPNGDLISRADAIKAVQNLMANEDEWYQEAFSKALKALPSADAEPKWNCTANFVAEHLDKLKDMSVSEKLKLIQDLLGVEFKEENLNYKHTSAEADRPSGEWTYLHGSIGSYMTISCPFCGKTFNDVAEWEYNYCPSCGARMKGGAE